MQLPDAFYEEPQDPPKDELGFEAYLPEYPNSDPLQNCRVEVTASEGKPETIEPWQLEFRPERSCPALNIVTTMRFWKAIEASFRAAIVGVLPAAILLYATYDNGNGPWKSQSLLIVGSLVGPLLRCETIGLQIMYAGVYIRSSLVWVPILTIATAIQLYDHLAACFVVYAVCILLVATLMEGVTRKLSMVFLTLFYMDFLRTKPLPGNEIRYVHLWVEVAIGSAFGFASSLVPWPVLSSHHADDALLQVARNASAALHGLAASFWADTNLTRNVQMVRVRFLLQSMENNIGEAKKHLVGADHEWMLQTPQRRGLRMLKADVFVKLHRNLSSIRRVVDIVSDRPEIVSHSERAVLFGLRLGKRIEAVCVAVDALMHHLVQSQSLDELLDTGSYFDKVESLHQELELEFKNARREYFFETQMDQLEEFVPLMTFYVFCVSQICVTFTRIKAGAHREQQVQQALGCTGLAKRMLVYCFDYFAFPLVASIPHFRNIFVRRNANDVRYVIEAVKISGAMVASLLFYYYTDTTYAFLSGPTIIAFTASATPAEALVACIPRLTGTLSGVVVGFFIAHNSDTAVQRVAGLIAFMFCCRLAADIKVIGPALLYAAFIAVSQLSVVPLTETATMSRIQQSTFAIFIYMVITLVIFPCRPTTLIREARADAILRVGKAYGSIMEALTETLTHYDKDDQSAPNEPTATAPPRTITYPQGEFADIDRQLGEVDRFLMAAQNLIPLAVDEPRLAAAPFPLRSAQDSQTALKKIVAILRTLSESIRLMRDREDPPSAELKAYLRNALPCTRDTAMEMQKFSILMAKLVSDRRLDLGVELAKSSQAFSRMCNKLHHRKAFFFLHLLRGAVNKAIGAPRPHHHNAGHHPAVPYGGGVQTPTETAPWVHRHSLGAHNIAASSGTPTLRTDDDVLFHPDAPQELLLMRPITEHQHQHHHDHQDDDLMQSSHTQSPSEAPPRRRRRRSILESKIPLPASFTMPITGRDSEAIHTLTFSLILLAAELRHLLVAVEDTLQHLHRE